MANTLIPKKSTIAGKVPLPSQIAGGEVSVNWADQVWHGKHPSTNAVVPIGAPAIHSHDELYSLDQSKHLELQNNGTLVVTSGGASKTLTLPSATGTLATLADISASGVSSVNSRAGAVTLTKSDVGLGNVADGATVNSTDAQLRDRATHTGTQAISSVAGLQAALDAKATASPLFYQATNHFIEQGGVGPLGLSWTALNGGLANQITSPAVFGAIRMATANNTTANTGARINGTGSINTINPNGIGEFRFASRVQRSSDDFFSSSIRGIFRTGIGDNINAGPSNGAFFTCQESNLVNFVTVSGGVTTSTPTGFQVSKNQWNLFEFTIASNGLSVVAKINNSVVATHTTNIPNAILYPITNMLKYQADAGFVTIDVDLIYISFSL